MHVMVDNLQDTKILLLYYTLVSNSSELSTITYIHTYMHTRIYTIYIYACICMHVMVDNLLDTKILLLYYTQTYFLLHFKYYN